MSFIYENDTNKNDAYVILTCVKYIAMFDKSPFSHD